MPAELVKKTQIEMSKDYIYFINDKGDIASTPVVGNPGKKLETRIVKKCGIVKKEGYVYFVDKNGNVCCVKLNKYRIKVTPLVYQKKKLKKKGKKKS